MQKVKEWTLMFYLASDNPLAPGVVSQLKAIKAAGFHPDANVVTQFDPFVEGTPTHIFEVNLLNKLQQPGVADVGFQGNDPFVRNLVEDKLWRDQRTRRNRSVKGELRRILKQNHGVNYDAPTPPQERIDARRSPLEEPEEPDPQDSLKNFLNFCRTAYPAKHFVLFILGHGVVVGNDVFLFDDHASRHSISLTELGDVLRQFKTDIDEAEFELVSFHSCSVSSIEVAFELHDTANYMLASQGPAFVGSWPYRSILIRIFNDIIRFGSHIRVKRMFHKIFQLCFFNAVDFLLAGYSFQLTLINLRQVRRIKRAIKDLVAALLAGLRDYAHPLTLEVIQAAHLKSQSFFQEMYTDLYDFCFCISNKVIELRKHCHCAPHTPCHCIPQTLLKLDSACQSVMDQLVKELPARPGGNLKLEQIIVSAEFLGPEYQYSRGISVYFPWTKPSGDSRILSEYAKYKFHTEFEPTPIPGQHAQPGHENRDRSWLTFLTEYFKETLRAASSEECDPRRYLPNDCPHDPRCPPPPDPCKPNHKPHHPNPCQDERELKEDIANLIYGEGPSLGAYELAGNKTGPKDPTGISDCDCPTIKNYPRDTRPRAERTEAAPPEKDDESTFRVEFTQARFL